MGEREVRAHTGYLFSLRAFLRFGKGEIPIAHVVKLSLMRIMVMTSFISLTPHLSYSAHR